MSKPTYTYIAPVQIFVQQTVNNQYHWEAVISGHGETKYIYGDTRPQLMLKVCQSLEKKP